ncbi:hypothetical protein CUC08_Gglean001799 [Alternaria sp. MG1]|nr:hypothetical protein CUC08_Gglean001799 [Alternaria sp. MG1]
MSGTVVFVHVSVSFFRKDEIEFDGSDMVIRIRRRRAGTGCTTTSVLFHLMSSNSSESITHACSPHRSLNLFQHSLGSLRTPRCSSRKLVSSIHPTRRINKLALRRTSEKRYLAIVDTNRAQPLQGPRVEIIEQLAENTRVGSCEAHVRRPSAIRHVGRVLGVQYSDPRLQVQVRDFAASKVWRIQQRSQCSFVDDNAHIAPDVRRPLFVVIVVFVSLSANKICDPLIERLAHRGIVSSAQKSTIRDDG